MQHDMEVEVTFETSLSNMHLLDKLFNPHQCGHIARTTEPMFYWLLNVLGVPANTA